VGQESGHLSERNYNVKADRSHEDVSEQKTNVTRLGLSRGRRREHEHRLDQRTKGVRRARNARERYQVKTFIPPSFVSTANSPFPPLMHAPETNSPPTSSITVQKDVVEQTPSKVTFTSRPIRAKASSSSTTPSATASIPSRTTTARTASIKSSTAPSSAFSRDATPRHPPRPTDISLHLPTISPPNSIASLSPYLHLPPLFHPPQRRSPLSIHPSSSLGPLRSSPRLWPSSRIRRPHPRPLPLPSYPASSSKPALRCQSCET
jgi:hypothetical protein